MPWRIKIRRAAQKPLLVAEVRPLLAATRVNVVEFSAEVSLHPAKVATPATAARARPDDGVVQVSVPADADRVTEAVDVVTVLPNESWTETTGWTVKMPVEVPKLS